jgi:hypothetical protein
MYCLDISVCALIQLLRTLAHCCLVKKGIAVVSKSVTPARIAANIKGATAASQKLQESDVAELDKLAGQGKQHRSVAHPRCERLRILADPLCLSLSIKVYHTSMA